MGVPMAPYGPPVEYPPSYIRTLDAYRPVTDNTECNYLVMFFVAGVFLLGIVDAMRS